MADTSSAIELTSDPIVPLEAILCTEELKRRPCRPPDYARENRALTMLVQALADSPRTILQTLADTILKVFEADSAGMSLLTKDKKNFEWVAISGAWQPHLGGGTPRDFGPCGDVLDCNAPLLFKHWERRYPYLLTAMPLAEEGLLIPFHVEGKAVGTIWAIAHDGRRKFDAEDLRQLESIGRFASAAYQTVELQHSEDERRAATKLMEDAIQSRQAIERLNVALRESEANLEAELAATRRLQEISSTLIHEGNTEALYRKIIGAAAIVMSSDAASMQMLHPSRGELQLFGWKGFHPESAAYWEWVRLDSGSTCGAALNSGKRVLVPDVETCEFMVATRDLDEYRRSGIRAVQSTPLVSRSGRLLGMISTHWRKPHHPTESELQRLDLLARQAADLIERAEAEQRVQGSEEQLRLATEAADVALWDVDPINGGLFWPARVKAMFGISADAPVSMADFCAGLHPDDRERTSVAFAEAVDPEMRSLYDVEYRTVGKEDGVTRWVAAKGRGVFDRDGICVRVLGTAIDITARKREEEHRTLLINELNHRVKNMLATVQAIAAQTFRGGGTDPDTQGAFEARLIALAGAHSILTDESWEGAEIHDIVARVLEPHAGPERLQVQGPAVRLSPKAALAIAMGLHELATNAVKYGSLSNRAGQVTVTWSLDGPKRDTLHLRWSERGGPAVKSPSRKGFGSRLIERNLAHDLNGRAKIEYHADGVVCTVTSVLDSAAG